MSLEQLNPEPSVQEKSIDNLMYKLDEFAAVNKVFVVNIDNDIEELLDLDRDKLKAMEAEDLGINAALLAKYAYYIQGLCNREQIGLHFADSSLKKIFIEHWKAHKGQYMRPEEVEGAIIKSNTAATEFNRLKVLAEARLAKLSYLANRIQFVAQTLLELQQSKRRALRIPQ